MRHTALITGASGGLGEEFARLAAKDNMDLVLVARSADRLKALKKELEKKHRINVTIFALDLSLEKSAKTILSGLMKKKIAIDILINNAGFGEFGTFVKMDAARVQSMIDLNIRSLTMLTHTLLPMMVRRRCGKILNVASTAAFQPGPLMAVYYATKAYVLSFSEALRQEVEASRVTVTCLCPGPTKTGFQNNANLQKSKLFTHGAMDSKTVAQVGFAGMLAGKELVIPGIKNRIGAFATRFVPIRFAAKIAKTVQSPK